MKFKKYISVLLAIFILVSNVGLAFKVHYCMNTIASISLQSEFQNTSSEKDCCGVSEKKSSCCKDKVFHFQKKSENVYFDSISFSPYFTFTVNDWTAFVFSEKAVFKTENQKFYSCDAHAPPFYQLYHQFIFYA